MAKVVTEDIHYKDIAYELRDLNNTEQTYKPAEMASALRPMYMNAYSEGITEGYENGKQNEHNRFWSTYCSDGTGGDWRRKFANPSWTDELFDPPFTKIKATLYAGSMFQNSGIRNGLKKLTEIDVSETNVSKSSMSNFANSSLSNYYPIMKFPAGCDLNLSFAHNTNLVEIEKLVIDETTTFTNTFLSCSRLKNITIEGTIGQSIDFKDCPLTAASLVSVIEHLSDNAIGATATFKQSATNAADWSTTNYNSWDQLIATKPNWTITLM